MIYTKQNQLSGTSEHMRPTLGMSLVVGYYVLMGLGCAVQAAIMDRDTFAYDLSMVRGILCMVVSVCSVWLLVTRARKARPFAIAGTSVYLLLTLIDVVFCGAFADMSAVTGGTGAVLLLTVEFLGGVAALAILAGTNASALVPAATSAPTPSPDNPDLPLRQRIRTWPFWRNMAIYFIVFSMLGHWAEILFCRLIIAGVFMGDYDPTNIMLWDQWLFPFSAEGIALVMVALVLYPLKERLLKRFNGRFLPAFVASFLINQAVCTSIDFLTGMAVNQDYSLWDYRALPFNFMGQVCLQNSLVYTVAATVIVWWVYPAMERFLHRLPKRYADGLFFALLGMYLFLAMLYFVVL